MRPLVLIWLLASSGCSTTEEPRGTATATTDGWAPTPPHGEPDPSAAFDPRQIRMFPDENLGAERVCDLVFAGRLHALERRHLQRYPEPISHRVSVRCRGTHGEGWGDLVFAKDAASLAPYARVGERIRVRVVAERGFQDMPVLAFVAHIGSAPPVPPARWEHAPVPAGDVLEEPRTDALCAITHVGSIEPSTTPPFPEGSTHHALVTCRHALGEQTVAMSFPRAKQLAALRLRRAEVVPVRVTESETEMGTRIVLYEGP